MPISICLLRVHPLILQSALLCCLSVFGSILVTTHNCHHAYGSLPPLHSNTSKGDCTQDYSFLMYKQYSKQSLGTYELLVVLHAEGDTCGNDATIHELQKKLKGTPANSKMEVPYPVIMHHCVQCSSCIKSHACSS